jgi:hypothetical protein
LSWTLLAGLSWSKGCRRHPFTRHAGAVHIGAFLQFGSGIPLGLFTAG